MVVITKIETEFVYMYGEECLITTYYYSDGTTREVVKRCA